MNANSDRANGLLESFSRERLAGYDPDVLGRKTVLLVGVGALGQNTLINLALSGVHELRLVDHDLFEPHNRTRSPCYPTVREQSALGLEKARVVASRIAPLMTAAHPRVRFAVARIQGLGLGAFAGVDAVVSCVDNARARAYLADATRLLGLPLIEAGFDGAELSLSCYPAARGRHAAQQPCWRCSHVDLAGAFSCRFTAERAEAEGVIPAIQAAAATLGGLQAECTIMALHQQFPLGGRVFDLNIRTGKSRVTKLVIDPVCSGAHRSLPRRKLALDAGPADTVRDLLAELSDRLAGAAVVRLPDPFVLSAHCSNCGHLVEVGEPSWSWASDTLCAECGGHHLRTRAAAPNRVPEVFAEVDQTVPNELLGLACSKLGLGPLDLLETADLDDRTIVVRINGSLRDIFEQASPLGSIDGSPRLANVEH